LEGGAVPADEVAGAGCRCAPAARARAKSAPDGIVFDITDAKRAEAEIRKLRAHLEEVKEADRAAVAREIYDDIGAIFRPQGRLAWLRRRAAEEPVRERPDSTPRN
jgi:hypothetical protein